MVATAWRLRRNRTKAGSSGLTSEDLSLCRGAPASLTSEPGAGAPFTPVTARLFPFLVSNSSDSRAKRRLLGPPESEAGLAEWNGSSKADGPGRRSALLCSMPSPKRRRHGHWAVDRDRHGDRRHRRDAWSATPCSFWCLPHRLRRLADAAATEVVGSGEKSRDHTSLAGTGSRAAAPAARPARRGNKPSKSFATMRR